MSIAKIKAMTETLAKMEEMQKATQDDISKDITKKRKAAFKEICKYLDEVAEALDGRELIINFPKGTIFYDDGEGIRFNSNYRTSSRGIGPEWSKDKLPWWIGSYSGQKHSNEQHFHHIDSQIRIENDKGEIPSGIVSLIENWVKVKTLIESEIEQQLVKQMEVTRKKTEKAVTSYKIVEDFEV